MLRISTLGIVFLAILASQSPYALGALERDQLRGGDNFIDGLTGKSSQGSDKSGADIPATLNIPESDVAELQDIANELMSAAAGPAAALRATARQTARELSRLILAEQVAGRAPPHPTVEVENNSHPLMSEKATAIGQRNLLHASLGGDKKTVRAKVNANPYVSERARSKHVTGLLQISAKDVAALAAQNQNDASDDKNHPVQPEPAADDVNGPVHPIMRGKAESPDDPDDYPESRAGGREKEAAFAELDPSKTSCDDEEDDDACTGTAPRGHQGREQQRAGARSAGRQASARGRHLSLAQLSLDQLSQMAATNPDMDPEEAEAQKEGMGGDAEHMERVMEARGGGLASDEEMGDDV